MTYVRMRDARARLRDGEATDEDYAWASRRRTVLEEWPDDLSIKQKEELAWLNTLLERQKA